MRLLVVGCAVGCAVSVVAQNVERRREHVLDVSAYRDRVEGALIGQAFGLAWGFAGGIEFRYRRRIVPADAVADPSELDLAAALRAPAGDDFYCEMAGVEALLRHGPGVLWRQLEPFYRDTEYPLWHADVVMRNNLQKGVRAPMCGHYRHQLENAACGHADDLDAQMQADFCGLTNPGNSHAAIAQAWKVGHMMGYGDGALGAAVIAAMNAEAFVADGVRAIVEAGIGAAPVGSGYRKLLDDVVTWHARWPADWTKTWLALDARYGDVDRCPRGQGRPFNIDARLHGGFIVMGLLYGGADFERSLRITIRCGQDTDTSAQNLGSILGAYLGAKGLPVSVRERGRTLRDVTVEGSERTFGELPALFERIAEAGLAMTGGAPCVRHVTPQWIVRPRPLAPPILEQWPTEPDTAPRVRAKITARAGGRITFHAEAVDDDGVRAYQWHFGDLAFADGPTVTHAYPLPGSYSAVCYVADTGGHTSYVIVPVDVGPAEIGR